MFPLGINNRGEVVGGGDSADGQGREPFLWRDGQRLNLNELVDPPVDLEFARVITEQGVIYATSYLYGGGAALYRLTPAASGRYSSVELHRASRTLHFFVSPHEQVVDGATLWDRGTLHPLGSLGTDRVYAQSVNSRNEVVGFAQPAGAEAYRAFYWEGSMRDLNDLVQAPGWVIHSAASINEYGQIAAMGYNGEYHCAMRLIPLPRLTAARTANGAVSVRLLPGAPRAVSVETSADLVHWQPQTRIEQPGPEVALDLPRDTSAKFMRMVRE